RDELATPNVSYSGVDSVRLSFDLAALTYSYPGSTGTPLDTLEILVSRDCGNSYTSVYKKWGEELQTVNDPNNANIVEFFPTAAGQWRRESIDLSAFAPDGPVMVFFRVTNNYENNIFIDNVNITTKVLPDALKQKGYLVLPNPFSTSFSVWHWQTPVALKFISVYNTAGQLVWTKQYNGNAEKLETIDMSRNASGMYLVKFSYGDGSETVTESVIKL
ncbi:MAG TPA: T9SS type A sorting domain-containing protein, partial [Chitinophagaceae bacterium]|nr:T9SS type A sorting domain-containing protein [Chitinophagaceae bacterium]